MMGRDRKGSILMVALWSLFLLSFFAAIIGSEVRQKLELVRRLNEREALLFACETGMQRAAAAVKGEYQKTYQAQTDVWNNDRGFRDVYAGDAKVSLVHYAAGPDGAALTLYGLTDEESKVNINTAPEKVMERLFRVCGLDEGPAQDLANSIVDWRDTDSFLSVPTGSAESSYYRGLELPYEAKNAPFECLDELLLVKGVTENVFKNIRNYITIYGDGTVNVNTAPRQVLVALGLSEDTADLVTGYRAGKDGAAGTPDDNVFTVLSDLQSGLSSAYRLSDLELSEISALSNGGMAGVRSRYFSVHALASMQQGRGSRSLDAVIDTEGNIVYWAES